MTRRMAAIIAAMALLGGCDKPSPVSDGAEADLDAINAAKPPVQPVRLVALGAPDMESHELYNPACTFAEPGSMAALFLGFADKGAIKIGNKVHILAADAGSARIEGGMRSRFVGKHYVLMLGSEALEVRDPQGRVLKRIAGVLRCP